MWFSYALVAMVLISAPFWYLRRRTMRQFVLLIPTVRAYVQALKDAKAKGENPATVVMPELPSALAALPLASMSEEDPFFRIQRGGQMLRYFKRHRHKVPYETFGGLFMVLLVILLVRSFWLEPFRIPSGSMLPTLQAGDVVVVTRYSYGLRLPLSNQVMISTGKPKVGDVVVFHYPPNPDEYFIKRVVGTPGDTIRFVNNTLYINGVEQPQHRVGPYVNPDQQPGDPTEYQETLGGVVHDILRMPSVYPVTLKLYGGNYWDQIRFSTPEGQQKPFVARSSYCHLLTDTHFGFECTIPEGQYFVMGDNRDNSDDSRFWGFVPMQNMVGKAVFIFFNSRGHFGRLGRIR